MVDWNEEIKKLKKKYLISSMEFEPSITRFMVANDWFGETPFGENGLVGVSNEFMNKHGWRIETFCRYYGSDTQTKITYLEMQLKKKLPETYSIYQKYCADNDLDINISYMLLDFLLFHLPGEIRFSTDLEIASLVEAAYDDLPKIYGESLTDFINWIRVDYTPRPVYKNTYFLRDYSTREENSAAYGKDYYLKILFHMYNEDYINENDMYGKAAESRNYVDTWLFISLHFLCAIRYTDLVRFPHPILPIPAEKVLEEVKNGTFSEVNAKYTLLSITQYLATVSLTPNKTKNTSGVSSIKFHVPRSVETHIGTLFAIAQAHFQLSGIDQAVPLIRAIKTYDEINRYMGEEIGELFLESNFRSRSANKSFMQMIYLLTDDVLTENEEFNVKGYMLASLARSHKGSYGKFASSTSIYLRDEKMSGHSAEFVAKELFERRVLSSVPSMLLKMITGEVYQKLSIENQTRLIKELNLSPLEIEKCVALMQASTKQAISLAEKIYSSYDKKEILNILHRIGNGDAVSKQNECLCAMTAMGKLCPYPEISYCIGCQYEISTKTTMLLLAADFKRLSTTYKTTDNAVQKKRCRSLARNIVAPKINELTRCMKEDSGEEAAEILYEIFQEVRYGID